VVESNDKKNKKDEQKQEKKKTKQKNITSTQIYTRFEK
jgi:hypothetical protein